MSVWAACDALAKQSVAAVDGFPSTDSRSTDSLGSLCFEEELSVNLLCLHRPATEARWLTWRHGVRMDMGPLLLQCIVPFLSVVLSCAAAIKVVKDVVGK